MNKNILQEIVSFNSKFFNFIYNYIKDNNIFSSPLEILEGYPINQEELFEEEKNFDNKYTIYKYFSDYGILGFNEGHSMIYVSVGTGDYCRLRFIFNKIDFCVNYDVIYLAIVKFSEDNKSKTVISFDHKNTFIIKNELERVPIKSQSDFRSQPQVTTLIQEKNNTKNLFFNTFNFSRNNEFVRVIDQINALFHHFPNETIDILFYNLKISDYIVEIVELNEDIKINYEIIKKINLINVKNINLENKTLLEDNSMFS